MTRTATVAALAVAIGLSVACAQSASVLHDGRVLLVGGGTAAIFDPASETIVGAEPPSVVRLGNTATVMSDGRVLLAGGLGDGDILASAELYDPDAGRFSATDGLSTPRYLNSATLLGDGRVLVSGGTPCLDECSEETGPVLTSAELYDPTMGKWIPAGDLVHGRIGHTATLLADGRVVIIGGADNDGPIAQAEVYDPGTETFAPSGSLSTARGFHTATFLEDGRVLVAGGTAGEDLLDSTEVFDPATGTFEPAGPLTSTRFGHTATPLPSGQVLIAGGLKRDRDAERAGMYQPIRSAELYDPASGLAAPTGRMTVARGTHTASLLDDGRVLLVGGDLDEFSSLPEPSSGPLDVSTLSWEVYDPSSGSFE